MPKTNNPQPPLIDYNQKIIKLFMASQRCFKEYVAEKSRQYGFTGPQIWLIFTIYKHQGTNLHDLSKKMELSKSTVSGIVDRLVEQGVVAREIPEEDRRIVKLSLTPAFLAEFNVTEAGKEYVRDLFKDAPDEDLEKIIYGLEKFIELISKE